MWFITRAGNILIKRQNALLLYTFVATLNDLCVTINPTNGVTQNLFTRENQSLTLFFLKKGLDIGVTPHPTTMTKHSRNTCKPAVKISTFKPDGEHL